MAKGVVGYPVINLSVASTVQNIRNYGTLSISSGYYCLVQQRNNNHAIPVAYAGRVSNSYCCLVYGANYNSCYVISADNNYLSSQQISATGIVAGLEYSFGTFSTTYIPAETSNFDAFSNVTEMADFVSNLVNLNIEYISGVVKIAAPKLVAAGTTVKAYLSIPNGISVTSNDITITKGGNSIPFNYENGVLTFTAN